MKRPRIVPCICSLCVWCNYYCVCRTDWISRHGRENSVYRITAEYARNLYMLTTDYYAICRTPVCSNWLHTRRIKCFWHSIICMMCCELRVGRVWRIRPDRYVTCVCRKGICGVSEYIVSSFGRARFILSSVCRSCVCDVCNMCAEFVEVLRVEMVRIMANELDVNPRQHQIYAMQASDYVYARVTSLLSETHPK